MPTPPPSGCPDTVPTTGVYRNDSYGFTVTLPPGLQGFWNSARCVPERESGECLCMSDHGRDIPLAPEAYIVIFAAYTSEEAPLRDAVRKDIAKYRGGTKPPDFEVLELRDVRLAGLPACRYVAIRKGQGSYRYREVVLARTPDGQIEYTIAIEGPRELYENHRAAYRTILSSWRVTPRE